MAATQLPEHLQDCDPARFCITRKKWGRGYRYFYLSEKPLQNQELLHKLKEIPIPNTWSRVRISDQPNAYILATGYDGSDKLQYLYHPDFIKFRNELKFRHLSEFGLLLPRIRRRLRQDLKQPEWNEQKLLALVVKILDKYHLRIGSRLYAQRGESFGLTTLRKKHLHEVESHFQFEYIGKSGVQRQIDLTDHALITMVEEVADFPGWELFSIGKGNNKIKATAQKVNDYIAMISKQDFTAKTFRTWAGTVLTVKNYNKALQLLEENPQRKLKTILVDLVAERLGNTPAICQEYYIHPRVLEAVTTDNFEPEPCEQEFLKNSLYRKHECRTLEILNSVEKT